MTDVLFDDARTRVMFRNRITGEVSTERLRLTMHVNHTGILVQLHETDGSVILRVVPSRSFVEMICSVVPGMMRIMRSHAADGPEIDDFDGDDSTEETA